MGVWLNAEFTLVHRGTFAGAIGRESMKDQRTIVLEAVRRAQAKIAFYLEPGNRNAEKAFKEIAQILDDREVMSAMKSLSAPTQAPSVSPDFNPEQEDVEAS
jgi:hypothetical protein